MPRNRGRIVRMAAGLALAATAIGLVLAAPRLRAQDPKPSDAPAVSGPVLLPGPPADAAPPMPNPLPPAIEAKAVTPTPSSPPTPAPSPTPVEDPEAAARKFVEKSQREADEAVKALSKEAEALRARLQKVEAGLACWQAVKEALASDGLGSQQAWRSRGDGEAVTTVVEPAPSDEPPAAVRPTPSRPSRPSRLRPVTPRSAPGEGDLPAARPGRSPFDLEASPPARAPRPPGPEGDPAPILEPAEPDAAPPPPVAPSPKPRREGATPRGETPKAPANPTPHATPAET